MNELKTLIHDIDNLSELFLSFSGLLYPEKLKILREFNDVLKQNCSLTSLEINSLSENLFNIIVPTLIHHPSIVKLDLCSNIFYTLETVESILKFNTNITSLNLSNNYITNEGIKFLSPGLKINTTLLSIDLSNNSFNFKGAEILYDIFWNRSVILKITCPRNPSIYEERNWVKIKELIDRNKSNHIQKNTTLFSLLYNFCLTENIL